MRFRGLGDDIVPVTVTPAVNDPNQIYTIPVATITTPQIPPSDFSSNSLASTFGALAQSVSDAFSAYSQVHPAYMPANTVTPYQTVPTQSAITPVSGIAAWWNNLRASPNFALYAGLSGAALIALLLLTSDGGKRRR